MTTKAIGSITARSDRIEAGNETPMVQTPWRNPVSSVRDLLKGMKTAGISLVPDVRALACVGRASVNEPGAKRVS